MNELTQGVIQWVDVSPYGDALAVAAGAGATVLQLNDVEEFNEDGGELAVNGFPREYASADPELGTVTLTAPLPAAAAVDDPVDILTAGGKLAVEWTAEVLTPGADMPITVTIPSDKITYFRAGEEQQGDLVTLRSDGQGGYEIASQPEQAPGMDLSGVDRTTIPEVMPTAPPTEILTLKATGDAEGITAVVGERIEGTTTIDWYIDGVLAQGSTRSSVYRFTVDSTGAALLPDTEYVLTAQPRNALDVGTMSAPYPAMLNPDVDAEMVKGWIGAGFALLGALQVGAFLSVDPDKGLVATHYDPDTGASSTTTIPADGSGPHFAGTASFETITAKYLRLIERVSVIESKLALASGVSAPTLKVRASVDWQSAVTQSTVDIGDPIGVIRGWYDDGDRWIYTESLFGGNVWTVYKNTGTRFLLATMPAKAEPRGGVAKTVAGGVTTWHVVVKDMNRSSDWYVYRYNASWQKIGETKLSSFTAINEPAITSNGTTSLYLGYQATSSGQLRVAQYDAAATLVRYDVLGPAVAGRVVRALYVGAADFGASRIVIAGTDFIHVHTNNGGANGATQAEVTSQEWVRANSEEILGMSWDGTRFVGLAESLRAYRYGRAPAAVSGSLSSTFVKTVGPVETDDGGHLTYSAPARTWTRVDVEAPNDGGQANDPDAVGIYHNDHRQGILAAGVTTATYDVFDEAGVASPVDNGFAELAGSIGELTSTKGDAQGPYTVIDGNGNERHAKWSQSGRGSGSFSNQASLNVTVTYPVPFDVIPVVVPTVRGTSICYATVISESLTGCVIALVRRDGSNITQTVAYSWHAEVPAV